MPKSIKRIFTVILLSALLLNGAQLSPIFARTLDEIQAEIKLQKKQLEGVKGSLSDAEKKLASLSSSLSNAQGQIPILEAQIKKLQAEIVLNNLQLQLLDEDKGLKDLELEQRGVRQEMAINNAYRSWKTSSKFNGMLVGAGSEQIKNRMYQSQVLSTEQEGIEGLATEVEGLAAEIASYETETKSLKQQNKELKEKKLELESQLAWLNGSIKNTTAQVAGLQTELNSLKSNLSQLSAEQRALQSYEAWLLKQSGNGGTKTVPDGQYYFGGKGRDGVQGHGVGMSQYGARGMAQAGKTAEEIIEFYYAGAKVTERPAVSEISVKYCRGGGNAPALDAYQDGCSDGRQPVVERVSLNDYLAGLGEMPESWPVQARRAQMIAARTYALRYTGNGNAANPICLTTYCQVSYFKSGDAGDMDVVTSTNGKVVTYNGNLIETLYSADNNQGAGTADHDTRFQDVFGNQTGERPYLTSRNDNQFLTNSRLYWDAYCPGSPCGLWAWGTDGFTMSDIDKMLKHAANNGNFASISSDIKGIINSVGNVTSLNFEKDASGRVKKVVIIGTNGTRKLGGWWFKTIWNSWVYTQPRPQSTYITSIPADYTVTVSVGMEIRKGERLAKRENPDGSISKIFSPATGRILKITKDSNGVVQSISVAEYDYIYSLTYTLGVK
jgi:peptidoglycan hydrolase-like amidase